MKFKESEKRELKKSTSELKEAVISIAAILNKHKKGELYFGINNDGVVVELTISGKTIRDVSKTISEHIEPRIYPIVEKITIGTKHCIKITFQGEDTPYLAYGRAYMRVGDEDRQLSAKELENMFLKKKNEKVSWERKVSGHSVKDVNENVLRQYLSKAQSVGRLDFDFESVKTTLNKLNMIQGNRLLNACEVLFCDENTMEVQTAVFAGTDKTTFIDIKKFQGNIFDMLDKSEQYISEHINWRVIFGKLKRDEIPEIPMKAVREALVNSFCHRDYAIPKGNEIAIFKDRVEIYNPGAFPEGYTPEDFIKGKERSILRNPLIAETLYKSKEIEKWGSGLRRIYEECRSNEVGVEFEALKSGFVVIFYRDLAIEKKGGLREGGGIDGGINGGINNLLEYISNNPGKRINDLAKGISNSKRTTERWIRKLRDEGKIEFKGSKKTGGYYKK
ncbi:MAG TPA: transcriptional regulator [Candidatus Atribacteria bacterium]|nr:transcriptional regulator [Candidatus Atribacteria bacterium]